MIMYIIIFLLRYAWCTRGVLIAIPAGDDRHCLSLEGGIMRCGWLHAVQACVRGITLARKSSTGRLSGWLHKVVRGFFCICRGTAGGGWIGNLQSTGLSRNTVHD